MVVRECPREADVLDALRTSAWPDCCGADLRAHVTGCQGCAELVEIVAPLLDEHRAATHEASVPSAATVWWRMRLRVRREAAAAATRPIALLQGLALACGAGLLLAAAGAASPVVLHVAGWLTGADFRLVSPLGIAAVLAVTLVGVVTPLAIYFAVSDE